MLTEGQKHYIEKLPPERAVKKVMVHPYDPRVAVTAKKIMDRIHDKFPDADVRFMGASALGISGQSDIDLYILSSPQKREYCIDVLNNIFGPQTKNKWNWAEDGWEVSVYISDPDDPKTKEQLAIFDMFKNNPKILSEYEILKKNNSGKPYREYQIAKYEFYNRVLGI